MLIRATNPDSGHWFTVDTAKGAIVDADTDSTATAVDQVVGDRWSPSIEHIPVVLDLRSPLTVALITERAAMFTTGFPMNGWKFTDDTTGRPLTSVDIGALSEVTMPDE